MADELFERRVKAIREKIAAEVRQMVIDAEHWNRTHPDEEPIIVDPNIEPDVEKAIRRLREESK